jgi:hypothetical protein
LLPSLGAKPIMVAGAILLTIGIVWLTRISAATGYAPGILGPMLLLGVGVGCSVLPLNVVILSRVQRQDTGAASGALQTMQQVGASLGLALLVTVFGTATRNAASHPLAGATVRAQAQSILAQGIASAFSVGTLFAVGALVVVLVAIRANLPSVRATGSADAGDARFAEAVEDEDDLALYMDRAS